MLDTFAGSEAVLAGIKHALRGGSLPHAVLLCAPDGCGRNHAARLLAADYLYPMAAKAPDAATEGGSGPHAWPDAAAPGLAKEFAGAHPGALAVLRGESSEVLLVEGTGKSGQIPVDRIRQVRADVHLSSLSAAGRVVFIRDAHHMAAPAANALLKVLEEPPADVLFLLTAQSPGGLPATILSRCALYTLAPLDAARCQALLTARAPAGTDAGLPALLAALYDGRMGLGLAVLRDAGRQAVLQDALAAAHAAAVRDDYTLMRLFSGYEGRADGERERRDALLSDFACALSAALRGVRAPGLPALPPAAAALLLPAVTAARAALAGNAAPKLTFTALCAHLATAGLAG